MDKILILDDVNSKAAEILREAGFHVDNYKESPKSEELKVLIPDYVAVIVRSNTKITADIIDHATNLKVIGRAGSGVDNIDVAAATAKGIPVMNADGNTISAAEHTLAMMMALARNIPFADKSMKGREWKKTQSTGVELNGKTLGIIGLGKVGQALAVRALALKMKVVAFDPPLKKDVAENLGVTLVDDKNTLLQQSDFISIHTRKLPEYALGVDEFENCKKGVRVINCARDGLIDPKALRNALENGTVAGAALDVLEAEGKAFENGEGNKDELAIIQLPNVIITPHLGASTTDAQVRVADMIATQVQNYLISRTIEGAVNAPSLTAEERKTLGPHLMLASQLGSLIGQIMPEGRLQNIDIDYAGEAAKLKCGPVTAAAAEWLLKSQSIEANQINALNLAKDRGVSIKETAVSDEADYQTLVRIRVTTDKGTMQVAGTLINKEPRIVGVDHMRLEARIAAHMLFTRSKNMPGMVGTIGTILGNSKANMESMTMGKTEDGRENISFIIVDREITQSVLTQLKDTRKDGIEEVRVLNMSGPMPV